MDATSESFVLFKFLSEKELWLNGKKMPIWFVDHPSDATYALSGHVEGGISHYNKSHFFKPNDPLYFYTFWSKLRLKFWRQGKHVDDVAVDCQGETTDSLEPITNLRYVVLEGCLNQLYERLPALLAKYE